MMHLFLRNVAWLVPAFLLVAGCGEPSEPGVCEDVTCGANAGCSAGACVCDEGFAGDPKVGCTAATACTDSSCSGHGACDASTGEVVCSCEAGYAGATCLECASGYEREGNRCVAIDLCDDLACGDHGTCVVDGTASCDCDEGYEGAACDQCADGYKLEGSACVFDDLCQALNCGTNEDCVVTGGSASCECAPGYTSEHGECLNQKWVDCTDVAPANATSTVEPKQVIWNPDTQAWSTVAACDWACKTDFFETEGGRCINTRTEACDASGTLPEFASFIEMPVTLNYTTAGGWPTAPACEWVCQGDRAKDGDACVSEKLVSCAPSGVANATDTVVEVLVTYSSAEGWTQPSVCAWACNADYVDFEGAGACINERVVTCSPDGVTVPANAEIDLADVTITYTTTGGWTEAACGWKCLAAFGRVGDECLDEKQVDCDGSNPPVNQAPVVAPVTVAWDESLQAWAAPAACVFECAEGFADYDGDETCENTFSVLCDPASTPADANADQEVMVDITFDGAAWSAPAACPWTCNEGFYEKAGACLEATTINSCLLLDAALQALTSEPVEAAGYVDFTGAGVLAKLCVARPSFSAPVSMTALDCVDAVYDSEDTATQQFFTARAPTDAVGVFEYVYAFSGDEGGTWTLCDGDGEFDPATGPVEPGVLTVSKGINEQIADVRAATENTVVSLPVDGAVVTYVRPKVGTEASGFFVQGSRQGPGVFVLLATDLPSVGQRVSFTVTKTDHSSGEQISVIGFTDLSLVGSADVEDYVQDLSAATDVVTALDSYDNELVRLTGTIESVTTAGNYHMGMKLVTAGVNSLDLQLRLPNTLFDTLTLEPGCVVTVTGPMWRHDDTAQPSAYVAEDLTGYNCPGPKVVEAKATKQTTVVVTFDKDIDETQLGDAAEHFAIDPPLEVVSMTVLGNKVTLTTGLQTEGELYDLLVADVFDLKGNPLEVDFSTATFTGRGEQTSVCDWDGTGSPVLITQVFGDNGGARFDFVELFNRSDDPVDITDWSLQYASSAGDFSPAPQLTVLSGVIQPGRFHLVGLYGSSVATSPKPDSLGTQNFAKSSGKVALVASKTALGGVGTGATCSTKTTAVRDFVGYGTAASCYEGGRAPTPPDLSAIFRADVCVDLNNNATEFVVGTPAPRNSAFEL